MKNKKQAIKSRPEKQPTSTPSYKLDSLLLIAGIVLACLTLAFGWDPRSSLAIAATVLMLAAKTPYVIDAIHGKTKPQFITWMLLGIITTLAFVKQIESGADFWTAAPLLLSGVLDFINCFVGRRQVSFKIAPTDIACAVLAIMAIYLWATAQDPLQVVIFLTVASLLAFIPTVRKSFNNPGSETLRTYQRSTVRYTLITLAVNPYSLVTLLYPATWIVVNGLFSLFLVARLKKQS